MGMVLLAGLAYYQGGMEPPASEQDMMTGTAISNKEQADLSSPTVQNSGSECGQAGDPEQADQTDCEPEKP